MQPKTYARKSLKLTLIYGVFLQIKEFFLNHPKKSP